MGTPLGPKYIPYSYMDPLGNLFWRPGTQRRRVERSAWQLPAMGGMQRKSKTTPELCMPVTPVYTLHKPLERDPRLSYGIPKPYINPKPYWEVQVGIGLSDGLGITA